MERYYIVFTGQVQKVGFRNYAKMIAIRYGLTGFVQNLNNGDVAVHFQGDPHRIRQAIKDIKEGNMFVRVNDYCMKKVLLCEDELDFTIL